MKKLIAIWLSINLLVLNALPAAAQKVPTTIRQQVTRGIKPLAVGNPAGGINVLNRSLTTIALQNMRLPLHTQYTSLLTPTAYVPTARQILTHTNAAERALLLRTDFTALALNRQVNPVDQAQAVQFYRENLQQPAALKELAQTVADISSLGLLGTKQDAALVVKIAQQARKTEAESAITAAAARALLRLEAYEELSQLAARSTVQPALWDGIRQYAQVYHLPVEIADQPRKTVSVDTVQQTLQDFGPLHSLVVNPDVEATFLYMNAGKAAPLAANPLNRVVTAQKPAPAVTEGQAEAKPTVQTTTAPVPAIQTASAVPGLHTHIPTPTQAITESATPLIDKTKQWLARLKPQNIPAADGTTFAQRAALYLTAFSIGLEIGTPIMASVKTALNLPLSIAILITVATYSPYLFGSFIANWFKSKIGRKATINTGLGLMGGSFALGASALGLDGSFAAWDNQLLHFFSILGALTTASTGAVFIHNAVGPVMTEISKKASDLVRQKRGTYIELSRSVGMMASFAFPFIATSMLGMDWSAPFLLALPFVGASALGLNLAKLPNSKPAVLPAPKITQSPVMDGSRKPRKAMQWKSSLLNNSYVRLLREEPGVGNFIGGLFFMNAVEVAFNSGFLFMLPKLAPTESAQYLLGMAQYAVAFLAGRYLAGHFLKWFPQHNISLATLLAAAGGTVALGATHNVYALTAALFTAELGISTAFTLAFARTAKNHLTQDRITSLIMASAVSCAVGPVLLTQVAQGLINAGILSEGDATIASLIAIPSALAFLSAKLFRNMEGGKLLTFFKELLHKIKAFFTKK